METVVDGGFLSGQPLHAPGEVPLLRSKITIPTVPGLLVTRPRLYARLGAGAGSPLTAVLAPAGWGKTLLLCSWLSVQPPSGRVGWLSLDAGDNDPVRFWTYLLAALREACQMPPDHPLSALSRPPNAGDQDLDGFIALLVNALGTLDDPVTLILDDIHEVSSPETVRGLGFLLRHAPGQLHVVVAGRSLPDLPVERMRLAGGVTEIRTDDLAFTEMEVADLFTAAQVSISGAQSARLRDRAEGWPAGIRLAEMSLQGAHDPSSVIEEFSGDLSLVADYLMSEVLGHLDPDLSDFLMRTSIVDQLTGDLAHRLGGRLDAASVLERMERANAFIVSQGKRPWYRYHQLFREMLLHKLERELPQEVTNLHRTAADWFAANDRPVDAARHAIAGGDWETLRKAIRAAWLQLFLDGELATLRHLLADIPSKIVQNDAELSVIRAAMYLALGERARADEDMRRSQQLADHLKGPAADSFAVAMAMVTLDRARLAGDVKTARSSAAELLEGDRGSKARPDVQALAQLNLGVTEYFNGDRRAAERCLRDGLAWARSSGRDYVALGCLSQLTIVLTAQNRPKEAVRVAQEAIQLAERRGWSETLPMAVGTWHALGWIHYLWGELDQADRYLDRAEEAVRSDDSGSHGSIRMVQGLVSSLRNDKVGALALLDAAAEDLASSLSSFIFAPYVHAERIRILISMGQHQRAHRLLEALGPRAQQPAHVAIAWAELQVAQGELTAAVETLAPAASCESAGFLDQWLQAQVLSAVVLDAAGQRQAASRWMLQALSLGEPEGYKQPFLQFGEAARVLVARHVAERPEHRQYAADLLARFSRLEMVDERTEAADETLTDREVEVLGCLADMMTTPEIAVELFVSVNTVKAHLKHIYTKLDVSSRRQAVARGRDLGLLI